MQKSHYFSEHENDYSTFCYVSIYDSKIYLSSGNPNLWKVVSSTSKHCHKIYARRGSEALSPSKVSNTKSKRLSNLVGSDFIVLNNVKTQAKKLGTAANIQKEEAIYPVAVYKILVKQYPAWCFFLSYNRSILCLLECWTASKFLHVKYLVV